MMMIRDLEALPKYAATGGAMTLLTNRLSWFFNLTGPSVNFDTACSETPIWTLLLIKNSLWGKKQYL